jgi:hypothetical protein
MLLKVVTSHNGKFGRVGAGELVNYADERYSMQLIRMGIAVPHTPEPKQPKPDYAPPIEKKTPPKIRKK